MLCPGCSGGYRGLQLRRRLLGFLLPQALLRQGKRSGRKGQNAAAVGSRFQAVVDGDWGRILDLLNADKEENRRRAQARRSLRRRLRNVQDDKEKQREMVMWRVAMGEVGKAADRIRSPGVASMDTDSPTVQATLQSKFPDRQRPMPATVTRGQIVDNLGGLKDALLELEPGTAPGVGGMRPEFLIILGKLMSEADMERLEEHGMNSLNGNYPAWYYRAAAAVTTVPLFKSSLQDESKLRPLGIAPSSVRLWDRMAAKQNRPALQSYLEPQQQALSKAGAHRTVHMVRMSLELHRDWICFKLDVANAHSSIWRAAVLEVLETETSLRHRAWSYATSVAAPSTLESGGQAWGEAGEGLMQGKPSSQGYFSVGWHPEVRKLDAEVSSEGAARVFSDDGYIFGHPDVVIPAYLRFEQRILNRCGLRLEREKTVIYARDG